MTNSSFEFWRGKRVFVTSASSVLGSWSCLFLLKLGADVFGYGQASKAPSSFFDLSNLGQKISMTYGDLRDERTLNSALEFSAADVVLHLGESGFLFDESRQNPDFLSRQIIGTACLLEQLRQTGTVRSLVVASSDKVYSSSIESSQNISESTPIRASDLLSTSKLCSEFIALSYRHTFFNPRKYNKHKMSLATARLCSGVGGGDFAEGSFMTDLMASLQQKTGLELRHPDSLRPWISYLDQVSGILKLAEGLWVRGPKLAGTYNLAASKQASVYEFSAEIERRWGGQRQNELEVSLNVSSEHGMMSGALAFQDLGWRPLLGWDDILNNTVAWYKSFYHGSVASASEAQIQDYLLKWDMAHA